MPAAMFSAFGRQVEVARREGYSGVMVVADMDWLLPLELSVDELVSFELLLDRCISELGATVVCAYRRVSFGPEVLMGASCVHPVDAGGQRPPFRLVAGLPGAWRLSGEIDIGVADHFEAALEAATSCGHCDIDVSDLEFIDVSGLRAIARAASSCGIRLFNAPAIVRRAWQVSGLADEGPAVRFVAPALEP